MAEQIINVVPGEERLITFRIVCAAPQAAVANAVPEDIEMDEPAPAGAVDGEIGPAGAGAEPPAPQANLPRVRGPNQQAPAGAAQQENLSRVGMFPPAARKSRKNRKNVGATRKNRKQSGGNGYMNFAKQERPKVLSQHPELKSNVVAVARKIGEAWRKLSESERKKY
jgi:hypothetical protein